jgi:hypothetical protein
MMMHVEPMTKVFLPDGRGETVTVKGFLPDGRGAWWAHHA